jgi:uncharacterized protein involved in type VI secretion and phage assembly
VSLANSPKLNEIIPYSARHDETSWAFLSRILAAYGEWFYYDGKKLIVGNPMNQDECRATFDVELPQVRSAASMNNLNTKYFHYDVVDKKYYEEKSGTINNANLPMKAAKMASDPMYPTPTKRPVGREVLGETDIQNIARTKQSREYTKCSVFTGKSNTCGIKIGGVATIHLPQAEGVRFIDLGSFRVLEVHHYVKARDEYENTFSGITALTETLPDDHIVNPCAMQEAAIVIDNKDPKNKGRIKVRFAWQDDKTTNWIPVQTPDGGFSKDVPKNRGFFFVPEINDMVLVGFMHGDPSQPYVMGSLFYRDITKGIAPDNNIKTIITKSGITITLNDGEGKGSVTIKDPSGNVTKHDGNGNVSITAPNTITLTATDVNINASNSFNVQSTPGKNGGKGTIAIRAKDIIQVNSESGDIATTAESGNITHAADSGNFGVSSKKTEMSSKDDSTLSSGGVFKINGASDVEINK